jgi:hypothetical protein
VSFCKLWRANKLFAPAGNRSTTVQSHSLQSNIYTLHCSFCSAELVFEKFTFEEFAFKINNLETKYFPPFINSNFLCPAVIKSRRLGRAGHLERIGVEVVRAGFRWENLKEGEHLDDPGVDERIILK